MSQGRVILAGHSHAVALGLTLTSKRRVLELVPMAARGPAVFGLKGDARRERYWDRLVAEAAAATVLVVWSGNQHLVQFLIARDPPFDVCLARHPDERPHAGVALVPEAMVRRVLAEPIRPLAPLLERLARVAGGRVMVIGTPPPLGDDARLRAIISLESKTLVGGDHAAFDAAASLTDRDVRRRLWRVVQDLLAESAAAAGARFVPSPATAADADGFLRPELARGDLSHANHAYGDLVWADVVTALGHG